MVTPGSLNRFADWLLKQDHPFGSAYAELLPKVPLEPDGVMVTPDPELVKQLQGMADEAHEWFLSKQAEAFDALKARVEPLDPAPLLCAAMYFLKFRPWGSYYEPDSSSQGHLDFEMLVGIVANSQSDQLVAVLPEDVRDVLAFAREASNFAHAASTAYGFRDVEPSSRVLARSASINRYITLRGSSYAPYGRRFAQALVEPYAETGATGQALTDAFSIADSYIAHVRGGWVPITNRVWKKAQADSGEETRSLDEASPEFMAAFVAGLLEEMPGFFVKSREALMAWLPESPRDPAARLETLFDLFGVRRGGWKGAYDGPLADPPLRTKPFLLVPTASSLSSPASEGDWPALFVHHDGLFGEAHLTIDAAMSARVSGWPQARARTIDNFSVELLSESLPGSEYAIGAHFLADGADAEVDGVILYEDRAIVVEGKGPPLKIPSRRGDERRLRAQIEDIVSKGWDQLERDRSFILNGEGEFVFLDERGTPVLRGERSLISRVHTILPTFDSLHDAGTHLADLYESGLLPPDARPLVISMTHLQLVTEILSNPWELLAYLDFHERMASEPRLSVPDEIEMLALFCKGIDVWAALEKLGSDGPGVVELRGGQTAFDDWYAGVLGQGPPAPRPRKEMTKPVRQFVRRMARDRPAGWLSALSAALNVPLSYAEAFSQAWSSLRARLRDEPFVIEGDANFAFAVARKGIPWARVLGDAEGPIILRQSQFAWLAKPDGSGGPMIEWAAVGSMLDDPVL